MGTADQEIEVTPAMIAAGATVLSLKVDNPSGAYRKFEGLAESVFRAMLAAAHPSHDASSGLSAPDDR